jgi:hypothetical protein
MSASSHMLRACISTARSPDDAELQRAAAKLWQEAYGYRSGASWSEVKPSSREYRRVMALTRAAFGMKRAA